jgi:hypothetical protein
MHELDWLSPTSLSQEHNRGATFLFQVERELRSDPLLGAIHTLPFDALPGNKRDNLHVAEAPVVEPELIDGSNLG